MGINKIVEKIKVLENNINEWRSVKKEAETNLKIIDGNLKKLIDNNLINDDIKETYTYMKLSEQEKVDEANSKIDNARLDLRNLKADERKVKRMIDKLSNMGVEIVK